MKAIIQTKYGNEKTLQLTDQPTPQLVTPDQYVINVLYANISAGDQHLNTLDIGWPMSWVIRALFGISRPRAIRGISGMGIIHECGTKTSRFSSGDVVVFINSMKASVMAETLLLQESSIISNVHISKDQYPGAAPLAFGALSASYFINEKTIQSGDHVVIYGASGSVGSYAVALAKRYGATVTAVARKTHWKKLDPLGADQWIDYTDPAFLELKEVDVVFDAVGKLQRKDRKRLLGSKGTFYSIKRPTNEDNGRLDKLAAWYSDQTLPSIIDHIYPLEQYQQAHHHVYSGHKTGNVIIQISSKNDD